MKPTSFTIKSGEKVKIRPIKNTPEDTKAALKFINAIRAENVLVTNFGPPISYAEEKAWVKKSVEKEKQSEKVLLAAFHKEKMVGTSDIEKKDGRSPHVGIFGIVLARDFRGEGLGKELMARIIKRADKLKLTHLELSVYQGNEPAIKLYESFGFKKVGRKPEAISYKGKLIAEIIMWKKL